MRKELLDRIRLWVSAGIVQENLKLKNIHCILKRRKHLTEWDCQRLAQSREGSCSLTQPFHQWSSRNDVNKGLYPRSRNKTWPRGTVRAVCVNRSSDYKIMDLANSSSNSDHGAAMEEDAALSSGQIDENIDIDDMADSPTKPTSNRKRPFSSLESCSKDIIIDPPSEDSVCCGNFFEEKDDDEMVHLLDSLPDQHYGLLGVSGENKQSFDLLSQFPTELLQHIFGFLPFEDLYHNVSLVCKEWKALVEDVLVCIIFVPLFVISFFKKQNDSPGDTFFLLDLQPANEAMISGVSRCFASVVHVRQTDFKKILDSLKFHHLYQMSERSAASRCPDLRDDTGTINAWAVVAVLVLLTRNVPDIQKLIICLQRPSSPLKLIEVMEALYCLALLVYAMREEKILITNSFRNKPSFQLTNEQQQIINHNIQPGQVVKIMAFAGTGKTSTLIKYAEKRPGLRFLYVTFNKSIADHAFNIFPENVTCKTFHSLAFQETGKLYRQRNKINPSKLTAYTVNFVLPEGQAGFVRAKLVVKTLEHFFASADTEIEVDHVPIWCKNNRGELQIVSPQQQQFAVREANRIWERMKSLDETKELAYKITHDGYLKLWQLRRPNLSSYDVIFVDEAQDCTPSIMEVVLFQTCGKIFVGDPHQQIYTFRGAVNALCEVPHTHIFYLTQSFRFGAEIAYIGATILDVCKNVRNKTLVGNNQKGTVHESSQSKVAILSRSNSCVFDQAVLVTEGETPSKIHIIGGPEKFGLNKIYDIWILQQPESEINRQRLYIQDKFIATWLRRGGFAALKEYAVSSEDRELEGRIAIVEKYNRRIPELVKRITTCNTPDGESADYILGTVHKAKGMEFDTVEITDDFVKVSLPRHNLRRAGIPLDLSVEDEWNLVYVAVTRAKKHLIITKSIENVLTLAGEYSLKAELTSEVIKEAPVLCTLGHCKNPIPEKSVLTMRRLPITYSDKSEDKGGFICHACVHQRVGNMTQLMLSPETLETIENKLENIVMSRRYQLLLQAI
ncbi:F-box DNA helicase 1 [Pyxicephalus adspersus]|uniref:F-box DNA helicase 1 n=1 Tax=Pyxicephalus adspersus TaxID=30357 RepID=UPI003B59241B